MASCPSGDHECSGSPGVTHDWLVKLGAALPTWRGMAQALGLRRLQELFQGTCSLSDQPVWLLGMWYGVAGPDGDGAVLTPEAAEGLLRDFSARLWFTYRRDFPAIGSSGLTSDVGWGCTLRSGQMLLAEALVRHAYGRITQPPASAPEAAAAAALVGLFLDGPSPAEHPFSVHAVCRIGAPHGVVAGKWLGPWVLCHALQGAVQAQQQQLAAAREQEQRRREASGERHRQRQPEQEQQQQAREPRVDSEAAAEGQQQQQQQQQLRQPRPLVVHVVCSPGGGAPSLQPDELLRLFQGGASPAAAGGAGTEGAGPSGRADGSAAGDAALGISRGPTAAAAGPGSAPSSSGGGSGRADVPTETEGGGEEEPFCAVAAGDAAPPLPQQQQQHGEERGVDEEQQETPGLLVLVPLTLGVGKINEVYHSQLRAVLTFPQSVGVVGGRPGASLYFVGWQDPGAVLYLDPHEAQEVAALPRDLPTYSCATPRLVPVSAVDPSLAIGFYCAFPADAADLCGRLAEVARAAGNVPLLTIDVGGGGGGGGRGGAAGGREAGGQADGPAQTGAGGADDWEML